MKTINDYKNIVKNNDGKTFWDLQEEDKKAYPEKYSGYNGAVAEGKKNAKEFLKTCINPANEKGYNMWKTKFNSDPKNVENHFVNLMAKSMGVKPLIFKDSAYEQRLKNQYIDKNGQVKKYNAATLEDGHVLNHFRNTITAKHEAVGYEGDEDAVNEFWKNYTLSTL
jgi:hypothetical protein